MTPREQLALRDAEVRALCEEHHIRRLGLFGSMLRDDLGSPSAVAKPGRQSVRSASVGATLVARRAGTRHARIAASASVAPAPMNETGSWEPTS